MLVYFVCTVCTQVSGLFLESEVPTPEPTCQTCSGKFKKCTVKRTVYSYILHCNACNYSSGLCSVEDLKQQKGSRPPCPWCKSSDKVQFINPHLPQEKKDKRLTVGLLSPTKRKRFEVDKGSLDQEFVDKVSKRRKLNSEEFGGENTLGWFDFDSTDLNAQLARSESSYQERKKFRKDFDTKHGVLTDQQNPLKTSLHRGTLVPFKTYEETYTKYTERIGERTYPKQSMNTPTVVNSSKVVSRDTTWDYRELGPNSFLRRLCSLLYIIDFSGEQKDSTNPVELQAMWAADSLFIASNNRTYSVKLLEALQGLKSVQALVNEIEIPPTSSLKTTGSYTSVWRSFGLSHRDKLHQYKTAVVNNSYPSYFDFKWYYISKKLRQSMLFDESKIGSITVEKVGEGFTDWTLVETTIESGKVYVVLPSNTRKKNFTQKSVHAEQMFYPVLTKLDQTAQLSNVLPAFIGGVKTPCRTCYDVLQAAADLLGDKLVLPTDAFGHFWKASGKHVPNSIFDPDDVSLVFGSEDSINIFSTEMPPSPKREDD